MSTSATITLVAEAFSLPEIFAGVTLSGANAAGLTPDGLTSNSSVSVQSLVTALPSQAGSLPSSIPAFVAPAAAAHGQSAAAKPASVAQRVDATTNPQQGNPQQLVPQRVSDPTQLASLTGLSLLQQLALLPKGTIAEFVAQHPEVVQELLAAQPAARDVKLWWNDLDLSARGALIVSAPSLVGNLEGMPIALRDVANRQFLAATTRALTDAANDGRSTAIDSSNTLHMLKQVEGALQPTENGPRRYLLTLNTAGTGTAAIAIGELATADYVSFLVPGMFYTVDGQMVEWTSAAQNVYDTGAEWIETLSATDAAFADASIATVAWIGYETPSLVNFTNLDRAYAGRDAIATAVNGLHEIRDGDQPYLSIVAHSYGSTATMMALTDYGIDIDALGLVGSPGSSAQLASDLGVSGDNVYVGEAPWDQVKDSAFFGSDPGAASFGAHVFSVEGGVDPVSGDSMIGSTGHNEYLVLGSESIRNLALIALGQGRLITSDAAPSVAKGSSGYGAEPGM